MSNNNSSDSEGSPSFKHSNSAASFSSDEPSGFPDQRSSMQKHVHDTQDMKYSPRRGHGSPTKLTKDSDRKKSPASRNIGNTGASNDGESMDVDGTPPKGGRIESSRNRNHTKPAPSPGIDGSKSVVDSSASQSTILAYQWLDEGRRVLARRLLSEFSTGSVAGGSRCCRMHQGIRLTVASTTVGQKDHSVTVRVGDVVVLYQSPSQTNEQDQDKRSRWDGTWVCRVDALWENEEKDDDQSSTATGESDNEDLEESSGIQFSGRWLFSRGEIESYRGRWLGNMPKSDFLQDMRDDELVLSDQYQINPISSIEQVIPVKFCSASESEACFDDDKTLCRYKVLTQRDGHSWVVLEWNKAEDTVDNTMYAIEEVDENSNEDSADEDSLSSDDDDDPRSPSNHLHVLMPEAEGGALRANIRVGSRHQVKVGAFVPGQTVRSRNPKLVWSPNMIAEHELKSFCDRLADMHYEYLEQNGLLNEEPYCPLPTEDTEDILRTMANKGCPNPVLTGSMVSTGGFLTDAQNRLLKECDVDAILETLHDHNYDTDAALKAISGNMSKYTSGWTRAEKDLFDDGFRLAQGFLPNIADAVHTKSNRDVIDYWFRFKIADQFRLYQGKKREQAIRMIECIEKRRYHEYTVNSTDGDNGRQQHVHQQKRRKPAHWSEASVSDVTGALEERRQVARALLLDVQKQMGFEVMEQVAQVVRKLHKSYESQVKDKLFDLLDGEPELQKRFLEFLPRVT